MHPKSETAKEISCRITRTLLLYVRESHQDSLGGLLDGLPLDEAYLLDTNNWVSHAFLQRLYHRMIRILEDDDAVYKMTLSAARLKSLGLLDRIVRLLGNPKLIYSQGPRYNKYLKLNGDVIIHETGKSWVVLEDRYHDSNQKTRFDCDYTRGVLAGLPTIFDLPAAEVEEVKCQVHPDKYGHRVWPDNPPQGSQGCLYRVSWEQPRSYWKLFFQRRIFLNQALGDLQNANELIQNKYDEAKLLTTDLEKVNQELTASKHHLELQTKELFESERKYRLLAENVSDVIWILNLATLKFEYISPSVERTRGFSPQEAMALDLEQTLSPESVQHVAQILEEELTRDGQEGVDPQRSRQIELEQSIKSGGYFWAEASVSFGRNDQGEAVTVMGVTRDISERKQAEEEKQQLEIKLQNAKKLESLGTLAGGVAHDLNNILGGIVTYPDLLLFDLPDESPLRDPLLAIKKSGERAAEIVQDLLTLARRGVSSTKILNLNQIVHDFMKSPEYEKIVMNQKDLVVESNIADNLLNINGSEVHIAKSLMNLVANAVDAMPMGGKITVVTADCYIDTAYHGFEDIPEGEYSILEISDEGIGMSASDLLRIFEPFYTKKVMGRSGSGLGMSVVWGTLKDHKGYIDIQTEEGSGTKFTLYFPASRLEKEANETVYIDDYLGSGESILVVDDVTEQRELAKRMMERLGYHVDTSSSGENAILSIQQKDYDILILDMVMPAGLNGLETYREILKFKEDQKAVIASGYAETTMVKETLRLGAGGYIRKPYTLEKIGLAVRSELDRQHDSG